MFTSRIYNRLLNIKDKKLRPYFEKRAKKRIEGNSDFNNVLSDYIKRTKSSGASFGDYWLLYSYIRKNKPKEVLECGTGITTLVMAFAMHENEKYPSFAGGRITSMEESKEYYEDAVTCFPPHLSKYVTFLCSPKIEDYIHIFRGVRYRDVPDREYDFVYVDGPTTLAPSDGQKTFDFDFIRIVERSEKPVFALVDTRMSTCWVFSHIFKNNKVKFDYVNEVGIIGPCTKKDLRLHTDGIIRALGPHPIKRGNIRNICI